MSASKTCRGCGYQGAVCDRCSGSGGSRLVAGPCAQCGGNGLPCNCRYIYCESCETVTLRRNGSSSDACPYESESWH
jgi:hypothetical protein